MSHGCEREQHHRLPRRGLLYAGGLSLFSATFADLLRLQAEAAPSPKPLAGKAKAVIFIFQGGGPSQFETWDPKPDAPSEIRGAYNPISTTVDGLQICEHLPKLARRARKYSIIRTLHHPADRQFRNEHSASQYLLQTGTLALPEGETTSTIALPRTRRFEWPSLASLISYAAPSGTGMPSAVSLPRGGGTDAGTRPGMLGSRFATWGLNIAAPCRAPDAAGSCPNCFSHDQPDDLERQPGKGPKAWWDNSSCRDPSFSKPDLGSAGLAFARLENRRRLLTHVEGMRRDLNEGADGRDLDVYRRQALELILTQSGRQNPFDLAQEPDRVRDLYGREEWGQGFLLARRLVEAGVRMVQVNLRGWDTHQNAFRDLKGKLLPSIDHCLSGLLDDLEDRGMLDETLIVMCGEMGRTPVISPIAAGGLNAAGVPFTPGRHHWGDVFPCFLAGGGIRGGRVIGRTDETGGYPASEAFTPADLGATIFDALGVGEDREFLDVEGRPYRLYQGKPIGGLF